MTDKINKVEAYSINGNNWDVTVDKKRLVDELRESTLAKFTGVSRNFDGRGLSDSYWYGRSLKGFGKKKRIDAYKDGYKAAASNAYYQGAQAVREKIITFYPELMDALAKVDAQAKDAG